MASVAMFVIPTGLNSSVTFYSLIKKNVLYVIAINVIKSLFM